MANILGYTVDEHDARVYHYYALKQKEECVKEKSRERNAESSGKKR